MAALDGATKSLMQGVSQQVPRERLDGQVSLQVNMLSDLVEGMRRRPGMQHLLSGVFSGSAFTREQVFATSVDIADTSVHVLVNTATGNLRVYSQAMALLQSGTYPYLVAASASQIQTAALRGYLYLCNTTKVPSKSVDNVGRQDPAKTGFMYIKTGQYSKAYSISIVNNGITYGFSYTAPDGTAPGDAAKATPEFVAGSLYNSIIAFGIPGVTTTVAGAYLVFRSSTAGVLSVTTESGSQYAVGSNQSHVTQVSDLPARLPFDGNGMLVSVGANLKTSVWYQYDFASNTWNEAGAYNSAKSLSNMPMRIKLDNTYAIDAPTYEGRFAGDDNTNEDPVFLTEGVTGFSVFQGRLVLLSGPNVCMSASGKPLRWYRSSVTDILITDPISIYSGAVTSTSFTHAVQFNKDLLLFSKSCQAVVPSGNAVVSPTTAQIVVTSSYSSTAKAPPIVAGRSLLYFSPRSEAFAAVLELVPSNTTDSQYTTNDGSAHIPRYMPGTIRQATASTTNNSVVCVADGDARTIFVQNYLWSGDEKAQAAWHSWTTPYDVVCTWFVRDTVYVGLMIDSMLTIVSIEPQAGATINGNARPFSDVYSTVTVVGGMFTVPQQLRAAYTAGVPLLLTYATGTAAGDRVGIDNLNTTTWQGQVVRNVPDGTYMLGLRYRSALSPTPPLIRDRNGVVIGTNASTLIRWELSMRNTGDFTALIQRNDETVSSGAYSGLLYSSQDLVPNEPVYAQDSKVVIPVRISSQSAVSTFYTDADHDLGVLTAEWVMQYHTRRRRA